MLCFPNGHSASSGKNEIKVPYWDNTLTLDTVVCPLHYRDSKNSLYLFGYASLELDLGSWLWTSLGCWNQVFQLPGCKSIEIYFNPSMNAMLEFQDFSSVQDV